MKESEVFTVFWNFQQKMQFLVAGTGSYGYNEVGCRPPRAAGRVSEGIHLSLTVTEL